ncbi:MAG: trypsin-like serine peptidase [Longimicrobiaceae bacterium]
MAAALLPFKLASRLAVEAVVVRTGRPALKVLNDEPVLEFLDAESEVWRERLTRAHDALVRANRAVGRIELRNHLSARWIGTGWLVDDGVVVTNRHVALNFAEGSGSRGVFLSNEGGRKIVADIDFLEEDGNPASREFTITKILHIEPESGPDLALLQVQAAEGQALAPYLPLSRVQPVKNQQIVAIGYPSHDGSIQDRELVRKLYGEIFDKKRLAPGLVTAADENTVEHDCSTLSGSSGSVLVDLETGEAVGLHVRGIFLKANFAVPARVIADRLALVRRQLSSRSRETPAAWNVAETGDRGPGSVEPRASRPGVTRLRIKFTCMCCFVADERQAKKRVHVLMPATCGVDHAGHAGNGNGHAAIDPHLARLVFPSPGGPLLDYTADFLEMEGWSIVFAGSGKGANTTIPAKVVDLSAVNGPVSPSLIDDFDPRVISRITFEDGEVTQALAAAEWDFQGSVRAIAQDIVWEIPMDGTADKLPWSRTRLKPKGEPAHARDVEQLPPLAPSDEGVVQLTVMHVLASDFPTPADDRDPDVSAAHFAAFHMLFDGVKDRSVPVFRSLVGESKPQTCMGSSATTP